LYVGGALSRAEEVLEGAVATAAAARDRPREARARLELAALRLASNPEGRAKEVIELAQDAIPLFEALGDDQSLGRTWRFLADVHGAMHCHYAVAVDAAERALACYERCDWPISNCVGDLAAFLYYGPTPVEAAIDRCLRLLPGAGRSGEAAVLTFLGGLEGMRGRFDEARLLVAKARRLYEELEYTASAATNCGRVAARVEVLAGDQAAAEAIMRTTCAVLERVGNRAYLATQAAELADVLWTRGCHDEAEDWVSLAIELGASDDIPTQVRWRCVRAKLRARRDDGAEAERLVREAIELAETTDALDEQAWTRVALAQVLGAVGRGAEASGAAAAAIELYQCKGNVVAVERARALREEVAAV
jgi:tetratricopeptide (TPR) repeat protein